MDAVTIINLMVVLLPVAEKAGVDIHNLIEGIQAGKTVDQLIEECNKKRDDLPSLNFGLSD
ncbi:MAG: hypothetical protein A2W11_06165 [Ignavibacteria bacterium RBG_16_35_7]|nr:MAG: hypothetical protein A2W11_06165 [Ignavibacteria bacterium RBG_16_35_7]